MNSLDDDLFYMLEALKCAKKAAKEGEVPVGAVIVRDGVIIARGRNSREKDKNALSHAEINVIDKACKKLSGWRLFGCTLYVTLEPCPMCAGAIINSRIDRVVFGSYDKKNGALGSVINLCDFPFTHKVEVVDGIMDKECGAVLSEFFKGLRNSQNN